MRSTCWGLAGPGATDKIVPRSMEESAASDAADSEVATTQLRNLDQNTSLLAPSSRCSSVQERPVNYGSEVQHEACRDFPLAGGVEVTALKLLAQLSCPEQRNNQTTEHANRFSLSTGNASGRVQSGVGGRRQNDGS